MKNGTTIRWITITGMSISCLAAITLYPSNLIPGFSTTQRGITSQTEELTVEGWTEEELNQLRTLTPEERGQALDEHFWIDNIHRRTIESVEARVFNSYQKAKQKLPPQWQSLLHQHYYPTRSQE